MKIKIWALVLIIVGSLALGGVGGFVATGGVALTGKVVQSVLSARNSASLQNNTSGGYYNNGGSSDSSGSAAAQPSRSFNAGVSVAAVYGELTNRSENEVTAAAENANTTVWGLAYQEGKLDELKTKVLEAVQTSLDKMVANKTATQAQADSYLAYVKNLLASIGQTQTSGWNQDNGQSGSQNGTGWQNAPDSNSSGTIKG